MIATVNDLINKLQFFPKDTPVHAYYEGNELEILHILSSELIAPVKQEGAPIYAPEKARILLVKAEADPLTDAP
jgi:hypothetical protein